MRTFRLQVTFDRQPTPFGHLFSGVVRHRPVGEIVGAVEPVHVSVRVDVFKSADGTAIGQNTLNDATTLWGEDQKKSFEINEQH